MLTENQECEFQLDYKAHGPEEIVDANGIHQVPHRVLTFDIIEGEGRTIASSVHHSSSDRLSECGACSTNMGRRRSTISSLQSMSSATMSQMTVIAAVWPERRRPSVTSTTENQLSQDQQSSNIIDADINNPLQSFNLVAKSCKSTLNEIISLEKILNDMMNIAKKRDNLELPMIKRDIVKLRIGEGGWSEKWLLITGKELWAASHKSLARLRVTDTATHWTSVGFVSDNVKENFELEQCKTALCGICIRLKNFKDPSNPLYISPPTLKELLLWGAIFLQSTSILAKNYNNYETCTSSITFFEEYERSRVPRIRDRPHHFSCTMHSNDMN